MTLPAADAATRLVRRSAIAIPHARQHMTELLAEACRPRPITTVSTHADRYRVLTSKGSGEPGPWRTARVPFTREILDALSVHHPAQRVVLKFAAQMAKTEIALNWINYVMDHAPAPMLVVLPTLEVRKRWVRQRLDPMLIETPRLRALFDGRRKRDAANAEDMKDFPGGMLVIGGANSPASLASMPIRYVICDEVDRYPWEAGKEGDPLGLIEERTKTFPRRKLLLVSTPTTAGLSRIDDEYQSSDQREYEVPCPHCGTYQVLRWTHATGEHGLTRNKATGTVYYRCVQCEARIDEHHKTAMLAAGRWVPRAPGRPVRGYHLSGLYSPIGLGFSWAELWDQWQEARQDTAKLKRFINTSLGEVWQEAGDSLDAVQLFGRVEHYPETGLPPVVRCAGIDVQKDRLECTVMDIGADEEIWVQDHLIVSGDTALPGPWGELAEELAQLGVQAAAVDTQYNTDHARAFCDRHAWALPIKGMAGANRPLVEDDRRINQRLRHQRRRGFAVYLIGVDQGKSLLYARGSIKSPGAGYIHWPVHPAFDDEYFAQLASEKLVTKVRGNRAYAEWVQTRPRNEALDCFIYALAAYRLQGRHQAPRVNPPDGSPVAPTDRPSGPLIKRQSSSWL